MPEPLIRRAGSADAETVAAIGAETFIETFGHLYPPSDLETYLAEAYNLERTRADLADPAKATWLVEAGGEAIGYALAGPCGLPHPDVTSRCGELKRIYLRKDSQGVILPAESKPLGKYLAARRADGSHVNVNQLGEAILGEEEAQHRLQAVLGLLARPDVHYVSVKISAIFSQINLLAWDATLAAIKERLRRLYRAAQPEGKFVNLDMEEYRDLALTVAAFAATTQKPARTSRFPLRTARFRRRPRASSRGPRQVPKAAEQRGPGPARPQTARCAKSAVER